MAVDKIANIKMNVVKVIIAYARKVKGKDVGDKCLAIVKALKNDTDFDVSYLAEKCI